MNSGGREGYIFFSYYYLEICNLHTKYYKNQITGDFNMKYVMYMQNIT